MPNAFNKINVLCVSGPSGTSSYYLWFLSVDIHVFTIEKAFSAQAPQSQIFQSRVPSWKHCCFPVCLAGFKNCVTMGWVMVSGGSKTKNLRSMTLSFIIDTSSDTTHIDLIKKKLKNKKRISIISELLDRLSVQINNAELRLLSLFFHVTWHILQMHIHSQSTPLQLRASSVANRTGCSSHESWYYWERLIVLHFSVKRKL